MKHVLLGLVVVVVLAACAAEPRLVDFGPAAPGPDAPRLPSDAGLDVADVGAPSETPPPDAFLEEVTWEQAASWIRRETQTGTPVVLTFFASWCARSPAYRRLRRARAPRRSRLRSAHRDEPPRASCSGGPSTRASRRTMRRCSGRCVETATSGRGQGAGRRVGRGRPASSCRSRRRAVGGSASGTRRNRSGQRADRRA